MYYYFAALLHYGNVISAWNLLNYIDSIFYSFSLSPFFSSHIFFLTQLTIVGGHFLQSAKLKRQKDSLMEI
jgi:hypothetical protein